EESTPGPSPGPTGPWPAPRPCLGLAPFRRALFCRAGGSLLLHRRGSLLARCRLLLGAAFFGSVFPATGRVALAGAVFFAAAFLALRLRSECRAVARKGPFWGARTPPKRRASRPGERAPPETSSRAPPLVLGSSRVSVSALRGQVSAPGRKPAPPGPRLSEL